jgi:hypothetical protein
LAELLIEKIIGLVNQADEDIGDDLGRAGFEIGLTMASIDRDPRGVGHRPALLGGATLDDFRNRQANVLSHGDCRRSSPFLPLFAINHQP